jgi:hypothetical protein
MCSFVICNSVTLCRELKKSEVEFMAKVTTRFAVQQKAREFFTFHESVSLYFSKKAVFAWDEMKATVFTLTKLAVKRNSLCFYCRHLNVISVVKKINVICLVNIQHNARITCPRQ